MDRIRYIHFIGIGGTGMNGIAEVMMSLGYHVSGSDLHDNAATQRLRTLGALIYLGHDANNLDNVDVVVKSTAINASNPELLAAIERKIPIIPRAEMLAELMRFRFGIAVAGTHGKTTTTSLTASILAEAELDPTYVIGGRLNHSGTNAQLGQSDYLVVEADESDGSFMYLSPMIAIVTNIDKDHLETYNDDFAKLKSVFIDFLHQIPFYGRAIVCIDDDEVKSILPEISKPTITYGLDKDADIRAVDIQQNGWQTCFSVHRKNALPLQITLNLPGTHNVLNSLAAIAVAIELGIDNHVIQKALCEFSGIGRRLQINDERVPIHNGFALFIDDYGHHPSEITATLQAVRAAWPDRRLVLVFQPHRYTRTRALFDDFAQCLSEVDSLVLLEVYAAGEQPINGADGRSLARAVRTRGMVEPVFVSEQEQLHQLLPSLLEDNDVVLTMGAGSIGQIAAQLPEQLRKLMPPVLGLIQ
ncbi:MAG TPA: UDP-N-acetylmuramate--L-alanine ligase [Crenotrichaceae bacterium]|nr:UDP-N-acetylmuramate--L-alanine ligase [Crenotrichaceae bacterium]